MNTDLPQLLVIGAMKAGTTSVVSFLNSHEGMTAGRVKEPDIFQIGSSMARLRTRSVLNYAGRAGLRIDGTTEYSKPSRTVATAELVKRAVPQARIIYLVRDPIARAISHYMHDLERGRATDPNMLEGMLADSQYIDTSRYTVNVAPWAESFGTSLLAINSDHLLAGSRAPLDELRRFLSLPVLDAPVFQRLNVQGSGANAARARNVATRIPAYSVLRPLLPECVRRAAVRVLSKPQSTPAEVVLRRVETKAMLEAELASERAWVDSGCVT